MIDSWVVAGFDEISQLYVWGIKCNVINASLSFWLVRFPSTLLKQAILVVKCNVFMNSWALDADHIEAMDILHFSYIVIVYRRT